MSAYPQRQPQGDGNQAYSEKLKSPKWQKFRLGILNRDDFTCRECADKDRPQHVHHCYYLPGRSPWEYEDSVFLTLCEICHPERQSVENEAVLEFKKLLATQKLASLKLVLGSLLDARTAAENGISVVANVALNWTEDYRWFAYAKNHPEARPFYEAVTGNQISWNAK